LEELMKPFRVHAGVVAPLPRADIDTDQIIPKQFLKRVERTGYGDFLFHDWRMAGNGVARPDFVLNRDVFREASILVTRENFGCGSSREHAAWALRDYGFRAILAPSLADIFRQNADSNGIAALELDPDDVETILRRAEGEAPLSLTIDIERGTVADADGIVAEFELDDFRRMCLMEGLDRIGLTLRHEDDITTYEAARWPKR
jgi:3-isopropylmalate/(R)-2-methylmalate dehydratase small subunit